MEKFKSIYFSIFRLADTNAFFMAPLQKLIDSLNDSNPPHSYPLLRQQRIVQTKGVLDEVKLKLLTACKGIYPYQYVGVYLLS